VTTAALASPAPARVLDADEMRQIVRDALAGVRAGTRVLAVIPDKTRDDNTDLLFPMISQALAARGAGRLDALVAQGTHPPMTESEKRAKIGAGLAALPLFGEVFDHHWDDPSQLTTLGALSADEVSALTDGLMRRDVPIQLNVRLAPGAYDLVLVVGAVVPHEVAGFAGGAKYFFPGVAGPDLTHLTHWLGALATIERVIGRVDTPTRRVIEAAADRVTTPVIALTSVVTRTSEGLLRTHALFNGTLRETVRRAAAVSAQVHVRYTGRRYRRVIALLDEHYDEMWVAGKASYKLGAIIEHGGELVIYAPHLKGISTTHGRLIEKYGYAPLEQVREMVDGSDELSANLCVAAHLAHVSYGSRLADGRIAPRYAITLASAIPADVCGRVKLGYAPLESIDVEAARRDPDTLVVENAGRDLYLVERNA
jgi:nickel-dependent lactate racemase